MWTRVNCLRSKNTPRSIRNFAFHFLPRSFKLRFIVVFGDICLRLFGFFASDDVERKFDRVIRIIFFSEKSNHSTGLLPQIADEYWFILLSKFLKIKIPIHTPILFAKNVRYFYLNFIQFKYFQIDFFHKMKLNCLHVFYCYITGSFLSG